MSCPSTILKTHWRNPVYVIFFYAIGTIQVQDKLSYRLAKPPKIITGSSTFGVWNFGWARGFLFDCANTAQINNWQQWWHEKIVVLLCPTIQQCEWHPCLWMNTINRGVIIITAIGCDLREWSLFDSIGIESSRWRFCERFLIFIWYRKEWTVRVFAAKICWAGS